MKNKKVEPVIVNGELYDAKKEKAKNKVKKEEKLPQTSSPASNVILTILGIILIIYGVNSIINKDNKKQEEPSNSNNNAVVIKQVDKFSSVEEYVKFLQLDYDEYVSIFSEEDTKNMTVGLNVKDMSNNAILSLAAKNINKNRKEAEIKEEELKTSVNNLFGNVNYDKEKFSYNNIEYTYNNETERYYLLSNRNILKNYDTITLIEINNLVARVYTAYTSIDGKKSYTLNKQTLKNIITKDNIEQYKNELKYFEYSFSKDKNSYNLESIAIK